MEGLFDPNLDEDWKDHYEDLFKKFEQYDSIHTDILETSSPKKKQGRKKKERNVHKRKIEKNFFCNKCDKSFSTNAKLINHKALVHEGLRNFQCDQCEKAFGSQKVLKVHIINVHEGGRNHKCDKCGKGNEFNLINLDATYFASVPEN